MGEQVIDILQECRTRLQDCASTSLDIEAFRDEIINECNTGVELLKELKQLEKEEKELGHTCIAARDLPNKMKYSTVMKEKSVVKNKIRETSNQLRIILRTNEMVVKNHKRVKIEMERVDDIIFRTIREISEKGEISTLRSSTQNYTSPTIGKEQSLRKMNAVVKNMDEIRETSQKESLQHRNNVEQIKIEIKQRNEDINDMKRGCYAPAIEYMSKISERRTSEIFSFDTKKQALLNEIEHLRSEFAKQTKVHDATMKSLRSENANLKVKFTDQRESNSSSMTEINSTLEVLEEEHLEHVSALKILEDRWANEKAEEKRREVEENARLQEVAKAKQQEESEHFAALWIQLRWKAYLKRKISKQNSTNGKKSKKGKKKK